MGARRRGAEGQDPREARLAPGFEGEARRRAAKRDEGSLRVRRVPGGVDVRARGPWRRALRSRALSHRLVREHLGELHAHTRRVDWARLLRRSFDVDALACLRCRGRLRVVAAVRDRAGIARLLDHVGRALGPTRPP